MRIDAHTHVWKAVPALPAGIATIVSGQCDIPFELLQDYLDEHGIERAVLVQPIYPGADNAYVADCAMRDPQRFAAVCVVDPRQADAADQLAYWAGQRGCRGLRMRPRIAAEAEAFGARSSWPLWETAQRLGVVVNVLAGQEHLAMVGDLAERFSAVNIVVDHFAHPALPGPPAQVAGELLKLARFANVYVKTSGYYYFSREKYPYRDCRELVAAVRDAFGPQRLLWGSDFPHVLLKTGYGRMLRVAGGGPLGVPNDTDLFGGILTARDREKLLGENALRLYWPAER